MVDQTLQVSSSVTKSDSYKDVKSLDEFRIETFTVQLDKREKTLKLFTNSIEREIVFSDNIKDLMDKFLWLNNITKEEFQKWKTIKN